jgi:hypothetical protein
MRRRSFESVPDLSLPPCITIRGFSTYFTIPQFTTPTRWRIYCYDMTKLIINYDVHILLFLFFVINL